MTEQAPPSELIEKLQRRRQECIDGYGDFPPIPNGWLDIPSLLLEAVEALKSSCRDAGSRKRASGNAAEAPQ